MVWLPELRLAPDLGAFRDTVVFSIIANNFTVSNSVVDGAADQALSALAAFSTQGP